MHLRKICLVIALLISARMSVASQLKDGDVVVICGDSITEARQYSAFMEDYLLMCQPAKVKVMQFGWSGETAPRFADRMKDDVLIFNPTFVTTCYGMNDGGYRPIDDTIRQKYRESMSKIVDDFAKSGARVLIGSPGAVDINTFSRPAATAEVYNENLAALGAEGKALAEAKKQTFADVHTPMLAAMKAAKAAMGDKYHVGGSDGVHPAANGHIVMAYAFLKGMGFDGNIGTFNVDLGNKTAVAEGDHKVLKVEPAQAEDSTRAPGTAVTIESSRYPFCFGGDPKGVNATRKIIEFFPFNQDLNRLTLKVSGPDAKYRVTWGPTSKEYTADQLKAGVNLAADFIHNPFSESFSAVDRKVRDKQLFETRMFKGVIHSLQEGRAELKNDQQIDSIIKTIKERHAQLTKELAESIKPVTHTITIEPIQ